MMGFGVQVELHRVEFFSLLVTPKRGRRKQVRPSEAQPQEQEARHRQTWNQELLLHQLGLTNAMID
jgi:hypothetical protein